MIVVRWIADFAPAGRDLLIMLPFAVTAALLSSAFALGGLWALRGRPALRVPACRRCRSLVRGAGNAVPEICPECGVVLGTADRVRWLRFRKQPLTLLITAPVVLIGGTILACAAAAFPFSYLDGQVQAEVARRWRDAERQSRADAPPAMASTPAVPQPRQSTAGELVAAVRAATPDSYPALADLSAKVRWELPVGGAISDADQQAVVSLCRDILGNKLVVPPPVVSDQTIQQIRWASGPEKEAVEILSQFAMAELLGVDELRAVVAQAIPELRCVAGPVAAPGGMILVAILPANLSAPVAFGLLSVEVDGTPFHGLSRGFQPAVWVPVPEEGNKVVVTAEWAAQLWLRAGPSFQGSGGAPRRQGRDDLLYEVQRRESFTIPIRDQAQVPLVVDPELDPIRNRQFTAFMQATSLGERDLLETRFGCGPLVALDGTWTLEANGERWEVNPGAPLRGWGISNRLAPHRDGPWPDVLRVHFEPRNKPVPLHSPVPGGRPPGVLGIWNQAFEVELRRLPEDGSGAAATYSSPAW